MKCVSDRDKNKNISYNYFVFAYFALKLSKDICIIKIKNKHFDKKAKFKVILDFI